jgi:phosphoserine phosphatase RsbU/P
MNTHETSLDKRKLAATSLDINALLEFSRLLNESDDPAFIFNNLLLSLMGKLGIGRAAVALPVEGDESLFRIAHAKGARGMLETTFRLACEEGLRLLLLEQMERRSDLDALRAERFESLMPLCFGPRQFAVVLIGAPVSGRELEQEEIEYTLLTGAIAAMALEGCRVRGSLVDLNKRLERRVSRLRSLFEAGKEFNVSLDRRAILRLLGYTLMGEMTVARFAVALQGDDGSYELVVNRFPEGMSQPQLRHCAEAGTLVLPEPPGQSPFQAELYAAGVRASIPMEVQGTIRGLLLVGQRLQHPIDEEDTEYLSSLANLAMSGLENARLLEEMIEKNRMEEDLRIAWQIQQGLLPKSLPHLEGYEIAAETIPSQQVGGDCYDVINLGGGRVLVSIADVSGKGTPASLLMANVQAALRALARLDLPLSELAARINDVIYENTSYDKFITAFLGIIDRRNGEFLYVNAGHNPPFLFSRNGITPLETGGLIFGVMPTTIPYEVGSVSMGPGDLLLLYTDGVSEALNPERQEYGEERMKSLFWDAIPAAAAEAIERMRDDVKLFARGAQQSDDITILAIRRD